jgi:hypothetical protein
MRVVTILLCIQLLVLVLLLGWILKRMFGIGRTALPEPLPSSGEPYRTGDLLLYVGEDPVSEAGAMYLNSDITHCALVVLHPQTRHPHVFHCTGFIVDYCILSECVREGPIVTELFQHVALFGGQVYRRRWRGAEWDTQRLWDTVKALNRHCYGYSSLVTPYNEDFDRYGLSCGVTVAYVWRALGLVPSDTAVAHCTPDDFVTKLLPIGYGPVEEML